MGEVMTEPAWTFGIDLGGTKMDIGMVDMSGKIHDHLLLKTKAKEGSRAIVQDMVFAINELRARHPHGKVLGVGIGIAGQIEKTTGVVHFAPNLPGWRDFPLQEELKKAVGLPVYVTNDVRAATWGEWLYGAGRGCEDLICIFVGTGIGGGIVSGGKMLEGCSNTAGEIGHMTIDLKGPPCTCGNRGCFEALASGWSIAKRIKGTLAEDPNFERIMLELGDGKKEELSARHLFQAARAGNPIAGRIIKDVSEALIAGVSNLVNAMNPKRIILGGGIINGYPEFIDLIKKGIPTRALKAPLKLLEIVEASLQSDAGVAGAAAFAAKAVLSKEHGHGE